MAKSAWADHERIPPPKVPVAIDIAFGAQPGWEPDREGRRVGPLPLEHADGTIEIVAESVCYLCYDGLSRRRMLPSNVVCGACGRYSGDPAIAEALEHTPPPRPDTDQERRAWESLSTPVRYPDRRAAAPGKPARLAKNDAALLWLLEGSRHAVESGA